MRYVKKRLPTVQLMPAPSEEQMISNLVNWRADSSVNASLSRIEDSCVNGFGMVSVTGQQ